MKLADWLRSNKKSDGWLAEQVGRDRSVITRIKNGQIDPPASVVDKIERITNGDVTAADHVRAQDCEAGVTALPTILQRPARASRASG